MNEIENHPYGYDVWTHTEVVPRLPPQVWTWTIGPVRTKNLADIDHNRIGIRHTFVEGELTVQLTADQQVDLSVKGEDSYGNPVEIAGQVTWESSDESIVQVINATQTSCTAVAAGPVGTASVTVSNDFNDDSTTDFQGSIAIDVVAGDVAEIVIEAGTPADKT